MLIRCNRGVAGTGIGYANVMTCLAPALFCALALAACSTVEKANSLAGGNSEVEAKKEAEWGYRERGVVLNVTADIGLNEYGGLAHAVALVVAQTADPAAFNTFVKSPQSVGKALQAGEAPGVLSLERVFIEPGSTQRVVLDRVDRARYIGVAAAYFEGEPMRNARLFAIGVDIKTSGIIVKNHVATPVPLGLNVRLGDKALLYARPADIAADAVPDQAGEVPAPVAAQPVDPTLRVQDRTGPETRITGERAKPAPTVTDTLTDAATNKATQRAAARIR